MTFTQKDDHPTGHIGTTLYELQFKPDELAEVEMTTEESCIENVNANEAPTTITNNNEAGGGLVSIDIGEEQQPAENQSTASVVVEEEEEQEQAKSKQSWKHRIAEFGWNHEFLILVVISILLAFAWPKLGAVYLQPDITASWIAVGIIFLISGIDLKTEELKKSFVNVYFNTFVQVFNFGVMSSVIFGASRALKSAGMLSPNLADGMAICACLPISINMAILLTGAVGGDVAAAVFNTVASNMIGVILSPTLILGYLGESGNVDLLTIFWQLALRVLFPVLLGQVLQKISVVQRFVEGHRRFLIQTPKYCLAYIFYVVFCQTFLHRSGTAIGEVFLMILYQLILMVILMVLAWYVLRALFPDKPKLIVMGLFGCTHKNLAIGVPIISAIFKGSPNIGVYTLPLLIWYPMQLMIGSLIKKRLVAFVKREQERLNIVDQDDDDDNGAQLEGGTAAAAEEGKILATEQTMHSSSSSAVNNDS